MSRLNRFDVYYDVKAWRLRPVYCCTLCILSVCANANVNETLNRNYRASQRLDQFKALIQRSLEA